MNDLAFLEYGSQNVFEFNTSGKISVLLTKFLISVMPVTFFVIYIDPSLSFNYHVQHMTSKISKLLYVIKSVKNSLPPEYLKSCTSR
jgi:hypothetical protein